MHARVRRPDLEASRAPRCSAPRSSGRTDLRTPRGSHRAAPRTTPRRVRRTGLAVVAAISLLALTGAAARAGEPDLVRHPSLSPDGSAVVFSWRGDLWWVPSSGGHAIRLTSHPADEARSAWSPDGRTIAFESDRSGSENVWLMAADGSGVRPLTREDTGLALTGWTPDGAAVTVSARREGDVFPDARPYLVPVEGGPFARLHDAFGRESVVSPDGTKVLFARGGSAWTRRGYRGADQRDVWLFERGSKTFTRLTTWTGNDGRPQWADDRTFLFTSDRDSGTQNVFRARLGDAAEPEQLTSFQGDDVWDLAVARDGRTAVCVVWGRLHRIDLTAAKPAPVAVRITAPDDLGDAPESRDVSGDVSEARLSPDGKVLAVVAYGDVFVRNVEDKHPTRRVTATHARERDLAWSPDGTSLWFVSDEPGRDVVRFATVAQTRAEVREAFDRATGVKPADPPKSNETKDDTKDDAKKADDEEKKDEPAAGDPAKKDEEKKDDAVKPRPRPGTPKNPADRWHDALEFAVATLVDDPAGARDPAPSPDGRRLAYRVRGDIRVLDIEPSAAAPAAAPTTAPTTLVCGWDPSLDVRWSPDSAWIAYAQNDRDFNSDVWVVRADGSAPPVNISRHPANDHAPRWSADGKVLAFLSGRKDDETDVWRVLLDRKLEALPPEEFAQWQKDAAAEAKKRKPLDLRAKPSKKAPAALDLDDAWKRLVRVTTLRGDEGNLDILPGGDGFVFRGKNGSDEGLFACNFDGTNVRRLVAGAASAQHVSLTGDSVVYVNAGRAGTVPVAGGATKVIEIAARTVIDREAANEQRFLEAARIVGDWFYDGSMKGLDWAALTRKWLPLARTSRTADEFNFVANSLLGELNASHLGIRMHGPSRPGADANGRLGIDATPVDGGFRVTAIVPYGPADRGPMKLAVGDVIVSVDGREVAPRTTLEASLQGRVGKETVLAVRRAGRDLRLVATPIAWGPEVQFRYDAWAERNEALVHERSGSRLGYLHIRSMDQRSLEEFERDLYAAAYGHDGLVIDVRNNGGGSTADQILASLMVQPHAYTVPRGADPAMRTGYPRDRLYIQRYVLPANLLCNEKSFSNAEILSHAFRSLKRGTLVGQETHGGVISTGGTTTLDGTTVRLPFRGWFLPDGTDMENHGAKPDLLVPQTPEAEARGVDEQLLAAVDDLLKRLSPK